MGEGQEVLMVEFQASGRSRWGVQKRSACWYLLDVRQSLNPIKEPSQLHCRTLEFWGTVDELSHLP